MHPGIRARPIHPVGVHHPSDRRTCPSMGTHVHTIGCRNGLRGPSGDVKGQMTTRGLLRPATSFLLTRKTGETLDNRLATTANRRVARVDNHVLPRPRNARIENLARQERIIAIGRHDNRNIREFRTLRLVNRRSVRCEARVKATYRRRRRSAACSALAFGFADGLVDAINRPFSSWKKYGDSTFRPLESGTITTRNSSPFET